MLVLSSVFPNAAQPTFGVFVRARAAEVARHSEVAVMAPVAWFPFNRLFRGCERTDIPRFERQDGLPVHHPRFFSVPGVLKFLDGLFYFLSLVPAVRRLRREFPFDVIDAHFAYPDGVAACLLGRLFRCPVTVTLRGTIVPLSRYRLRRRQIVWTLRRADGVIAVSQSLKDVAVSLGIAPEKIRVIPNGIDAAAFRPRPGAEARRALGLPADRTIVVSVGSLSPRKGHQRVIEALPDVSAKHPDVLYVVVGGPGVEGDTGPLLTRMIREQGLAEHVRLAGARPHSEIPDWLSAADVFCLASSNEGRANVLLEALACGVPVVATRVGGHAEVVRDAHNGFLVEVGDRDGLARALVAAMETDWDRASIAEEWREQTWARTAADVLDEFRTVLGKDAEGKAGASDDRRPREDRRIVKLWQKRLYRPEAMGRILKDLARPHGPVLPTARHLEEAAGWLLRAQDATADDGVSGGYSFEDGWIPSYPETTGYTIPTLLAYSAYAGNPGYRDRALAMAKWELSVQLGGGGFPGHFVDRSHPPVVFNTGQVIFGLLAAYEATGDTAYQDAAWRAGLWLASVQDPDGAWRRFDYLNRVHSYNTRTAWALVELGLAAGDRALLDAARRNLDWACAQQQGNGWFEHSGFRPNAPAFLHTIAYTCQGLLEAGLRLDEARYVGAAERACRVVMGHMRADGWIPGAFDRDWRPAGTYSCLTGNAQIAAQWLRLYATGGERPFLDAAVKANRFLKSLQDCRTGNPHVRGAIKGSHPIWGGYLFGTYPNWAAKFFMDALLLEERVVAGKESCIRCW